MNKQPADRTTAAQHVAAGTRPPGEIKAPPPGEIKAPPPGEIKAPPRRFRPERSNKDEKVAGGDPYRQPPGEIKGPHQPPGEIKESSQPPGEIKDPRRR